VKRVRQRDPKVEHRRGPGAKRKASIPNPGTSLYTALRAPTVERRDFQARSARSQRKKRET
jgi:hypothetical protein